MLEWKKEWKILTLIGVGFLVAFYLPVEFLQNSERLENSLWESLYLVRWYAREHVLLCLIPAFFIAGAISVFVSQASVMKYLGAQANKALSYSVAAVSGTVLAVCSCTVLPLFAGIYKRGAGIGPATAFLYSGPAINVLAIILTARILGVELGIARAVGAIVFSVIIGLFMHLIFRHEEKKDAPQMFLNSSDEERTLLQNIIYFASMVGILVFANWGKPSSDFGLWHAIYTNKWLITFGFYAVLNFTLIKWFAIKWWKLLISVVSVILLAIIFPENPLIPFGAGIIGLSLITANKDDETGEWFSSSWGFTKQIMPLLLGGVLIAGALLGRPDHEGLIPSSWISNAVGGNSIGANLFAAVAGAFMYFATLTEVPILQGLINNGMGKGPALALLLAGPALSLPNMLVIRSIIGTKKTVVFISLVIVMATISGLIFGNIF